MPTKSTYPIIDGHNDVLMYFKPAGKAATTSFFERAEWSQLDLPRAREGGLAAGFFAVFIEDEFTLKLIQNFDPTKDYEMPTIEFNHAQKMTMAMVANLFRIEAQSRGQVKVVRNISELEHCIQNGIFAAILHFEGAEQIDTDLHALEVYYRAGLRSLGIVWSRPTPFGYGVPFKFPASPDIGPGLTKAGKALVRACNRLGILIDLSHLNEKGFWDVAALSHAPLVATHSNVWNLCKLPRNLTDKQLDAIKESDGMVGVNMVSLLAREDARNETNTPIEVIVRHFDYLVKRIGIDRVGFGSDFGVAIAPKRLADASMFPNLVRALRKAGYDDEALRKLTHENWLRVLRKTWK